MSPPQFAIPLRHECCPQAIGGQILVPQRANSDRVHRTGRDDQAADRVESGRDTIDRDGKGAVRGITPP